VHVFGVSRLSSYLLCGCAGILSVTNFLTLVFWLYKYPVSHDFSHTCFLAIQLFWVSQKFHTCVLAVHVFGVSQFFSCLVSGCEWIPSLTTFLIIVFLLCKCPVSHDMSYSCVLAVQVSGVSRGFWYLCYGCAVIRSLTTFLILLFCLYRYLESHDFSHTCVLAV